jgi:glycosyltransferase involved in cell wall biosynthesis
MGLRHSIALCTYNGGAWLRPQLESLAAQTRRPDELVICDDGSKDDTLAIAQDFAASAPFAVRVLRNDANLGLTGNFSRAMNECSGDWIFFCDQDDTWQPTKIQRFIAAAESTPDCGMVFCDARVVDQQLNPLGHTHWQTVHFSPEKQKQMNTGGAFDLLVRHSFVACATMAVSAKLRSALLPVPAHWAFDGWIAVAAAALAPVVAIPEALNNYRQHPKQAIGGAKKSYWRRYLEAKRAVDARYYATSAEMAESLRDRMLLLGIAGNDARIVQLNAKSKFCRSRAAMRRSILVRYPLLLRELFAGRYHKFGQGWRSAGIDALV